jgi:chromosome partitioning protein
MVRYNQLTMMPPTIALASERDGVGKSTLSVNLAYAFAMLNYRVLVIDLSADGQVAAMLGLASGNELVALLPDRANPAGVVAVPSGRQNLDVIRFNHADKGALLRLSNRYMHSHDIGAKPDPMALGWLSKALVDSPYSLVILDTSYLYGPLYLAALANAHGLLIPCTPNQLALSATQACLNTLNELRDEGKSACTVLGIVPNSFDMNDEEDVAWLGKLKEAFGDLLWPPMPREPLFIEAAQRGKTIFEYASSDLHLPAIYGIQGESGRVGGFISLIDRIRQFLRARQ